MEVQNANLNIRIPLKLRERFVEVANNNGLTHSVVLRTMVAEYVRETQNHVLYRVTPIFEGKNLIVVLMELIIII